MAVEINLKKSIFSSRCHVQVKQTKKCNGCFDRSILNILILQVSAGEGDGQKILSFMWEFITTPHVYRYASVEWFSTIVYHWIQRGFEEVLSVWTAKIFQNHSSKSNFLWFFYVRMEQSTPGLTTDTWAVKRNTLERAEVVDSDFRCALTRAGICLGYVSWNLSLATDLN